MFTNGLGIESLPIMTVPGLEFGSLCVGEYRNDWTFNATLRVLLAKRENKSVEMVRRNNAVMRDYVGDQRSDEGAANGVLRVTRYSRKTLWLLDMHGISTERQNYIYENFSTLLTDSRGIERNKPAVEKYLEQKGVKTAIFSVSGCTWVFIDKLGMKEWHLLQSVIPALMPWLFEKEPVTDWEKKFLATLTSDTSDNYLRMMNEFIELADFRSDSIRKMLSGFEDASERKSIENLERNIQSRQSDIASYEECISSFLKEIEDWTYKLNGIRQALEDKKDTGVDSELIEFLIASKNITLRSVIGAKVDFEVRTFLDNFDADLYESYSKKGRGLLYKKETYGDYVDASDGKLLFDALFLTQQARVKTKGRFILDFDKYTKNINRDYLASNEDCVVNPHLTYYICFGNNERPLLKAIRERDYVTAISICISVAGNLNMSETQNVENFAHDLFGKWRTRKCIVLEDGTEMEPLEAINWLKEQNKKEEIAWQSHLYR